VRSTTGVYFSRLDHVRAVAAYLVFVWHFLHMTPQYPVPYGSAPIFPFSLFDEGHSGVALFMTLSGYLFAKLVGNHRIDLPNFLWSRAVRLGPLLILCLTAWFVIGQWFGDRVTVRDLVTGFVSPSWPGGAWSIAIELQFYVLLPLLLWLVRRYGTGSLLLACGAALLFRVNWWLSVGEVQHLSYWTIFGRIDQFLLGMVFALGNIRRPALGAIAAISALSFLVVWTQFDHMGGFYNRTGAPSDHPIWIVIPTIEAVTFGSLIAYYDGSSIRLPAWLDRGLARIGEWSYSIYLLHFFPAIVLHHLFRDRIGHVGDFYVMLLMATATFLAFLPVAALSYNYLEKRFLGYRRPYLREALAVKYAV
jgi:peptidoglycan/LPS O-acetylase OafA/YrhL